MGENQLDARDGRQQDANLQGNTDQIRSDQIRRGQIAARMREQCSWTSWYDGHVIAMLLGRLTLGFCGGGRQRTLLEGTGGEERGSGDGEEEEEEEEEKKKEGKTGQHQHTCKGISPLSLIEQVHIACNCTPNRGHLHPAAPAIRGTSVGNVWGEGVQPWSHLHFTSMSDHPLAPHVHAVHTLPHLGHHRYASCCCLPASFSWCHCSSLSSNCHRPKVVWRVPMGWVQLKVHVGLAIGFGSFVPFGPTISASIVQGAGMVGVLQSLECASNRFRCSNTAPSTLSFKKHPNGLPSAGKSSRVGHFWPSIALVVPSRWLMDALNESSLRPRTTTRTGRAHGQHCDGRYSRHRTAEHAWIQSIASTTSTTITA